MNNIQKVIYTNAISYYKSKDYLKASNLFYQLIKNDLKSSTCAYFGALSFYQSKKIKEAIELFEKTIEIKENFYHTMYARLFLVMLNIKQGDYEKANEHLNILLKEKFSNVLVYSFKGYLLYQEEDYEEAIKYYKKSLEMNPR